jgi:glycosyltransferase involved in cell wall biosynthesis
MKVAVVTPTIGAKTLSQCVKSVQNQTYEDVVHYIFVDGEEHSANVFENVGTLSKSDSKIKFIDLQENVGKGWYGHRVYAACSFLVNADIICYLDEDNWYEPDHVESLVEEIKQGRQWAYSLRNIYSKEGKLLGQDNCESLGKWPVYFNGQVFHIDTSSFAIRREVAVGIGQAWYAQWGADRQFFGALKQHFPNYSCSANHSLNYRLDGNPNSVNWEFFEKGNEVNKQKYQGNYPWKQKVNNLMTVGPGISIVE